MRLRTPSAAGHSARFVVGLLATYSVLAIVGAVTHRQVFSLIALLSLLTALLLQPLLRRRVAAWALWLTLIAVFWLVSARGYADVLLEAIPMVINAALAYWFGTTLADGTPRVARFILAIEGPARLAQPGVAAYARGVTWFWTVLLGGQALVLAVLLLCAAHEGLLVRLGFASPLPVSDRWASIWLHVGGYLLIGTAFVLEYACRRWRLRHLPHQDLHGMITQLVRHWPQLLSGHGDKP